MSPSGSIGRRVGRLFDRVPTPFAAACFAGVYLLRPDLVTETRLILAWDAYAVAWLGLSWLLMTRQTPQKTSAWAETRESGSLVGRLRPGRTVDFTFVVLVSVAGLAFAFVLFTLETSPEGDHDATKLTASAAAVLLAWLALHTAFALHYATEYYRGDEAGLAFPGVEPPGQSDFAYFSFTLGTSLAASDVSVTTRRFRRRVLAHGVLGFLYNTAVLGIVVNVVLAVP